MFYYRLSTCKEKVMDKTLSLICFLLSSNWDIINQKSPGKRRYSSRYRSKSKSSTTIEDSKVDTEKSASTTFHFLTKFKTYLNSQMTVLKNLLLKHLKTMAKKMPENMQQELFRTILLPNFRNMFPIGKVISTDVQFSLSEDLNIINSYLDLLYICMTSNDDLAVLFHKYEGSNTLRNLAMLDNYETASKAVTLLEYLCHLGTLTDESSTMHGHKRSRNIDDSFKATLRDISDKAILTLVQVGNTQLSNALNKDAQSLFMKQNSCLFDALQVILELLHEHGEDVVDSTIVLKCNQLLEQLFDEVSGKLCNEESQNTDWCTENYLLWLKVLLPIKLVKVFVSFICIFFHNSSFYLIPALKRLWYNNNILYFIIVYFLG